VLLDASKAEGEKVSCGTCSGKGNCNLDLGVCECSYGFAGELEGDGGLTRPVHVLDHP
jgi:hypothetical protein